MPSFDAHVPLGTTPQKHYRLTHDVDGDPFTCEGCGNDHSSHGDNAHSFYDWLRALLKIDARADNFLPGLGGPHPDWLETIEEPARARFFGWDEAILCWCGHTLHFDDCPEAGACHVATEAINQDFCLLRMKNDEDCLETHWTCFDESTDGEPEHWCKGGDWVDEDDHGKGWSGRCGYCGASSIIGQEGTGIYDEGSI